MEGQRQQADPAADPPSGSGFGRYLRVAQTGLSQIRTAASARTRAVAASPVWPKLWSWLRATGGAVWREVRAVFDYYRRHRVGLAILFAEYATFIKEHGTRREICVHPYDPFESVTFDGTGWKVRLPDCCSVCGRPAEVEWTEEERVVPGQAWPLWSPVVGLACGLVLWIYPGGVWWLVVAVAIGLWVGYRRRREFPCALTFKRCPHHAAIHEIPRVRFARGKLIFDVGHRSVHRQFWESESGEPTTPRRRSKSRDGDDDDWRADEPAVYVPLIEPPTFHAPPIKLVDDDPIAEVEEAEAAADYWELSEADVDIELTEESVPEIGPEDLLDDEDDNFVIEINDEHLPATGEHSRSNPGSS